MRVCGVGGGRGCSSSSSKVCISLLLVYEYLQGEISLLFF